MQEKQEPKSSPKAEKNLLNLIPPFWKKSRTWLKWKVNCSKEIFINNLSTKGRVYLLLKTKALVREKMWTNMKKIYRDLKRKNSLFRFKEVIRPWSTSFKRNSQVNRMGIILKRKMRKEFSYKFLFNKIWNKIYFSCFINPPIFYIYIQNKNRAPGTLQGRERPGRAVTFWF